MVRVSEVTGECASGVREARRADGRVSVERLVGQGAVSAAARVFGGPARGEKEAGVEGGYAIPDEGTNF